MNKRILDVGSVVALIALVAFGVFAVAGGLGGSDTKAADQSREASCLAGAEDCDDTGGDALGVCAPGFTDCVDTVVGGDTADICIAPEEGGNPNCADGGSGFGTGGVSSAVCAPDHPNCVDTCVVSSDGDLSCDVPSDPGSGGFGSSPGFPGCEDASCEQKAIDAAFAALDRLNGTPRDELTVTSAKAVEWSDSCLGVSTPDVACAEVITPGYIVTFDTDVLYYEFHTDLAGNAVLVQPAE